MILLIFVREKGCFRAMTGENYKDYTYTNVD